MKIKSGEIWCGHGEAAETEKIRVILYETKDSVIVERTASRFPEARLRVPLRVSEAQLRMAFEPERR